MSTRVSRIAQRTLCEPDAPGPEASAATLHEPPELLHFGDPLDGCANDFGIRRHAQELLGPAQLALVHEEGFALEWCVTPHDSLQPIIPIGIHSTSSRHTRSEERRVGK